MYTKYFDGTPSKDIEREFRLQKISAERGHSPNVINTDRETFIRMEHLYEDCLADKYGSRIQDIPAWIRKDIVEILWDLYDTCGIQYLDVSPYNFIEKNKQVWIIDFGHARDDLDYLDPYLEKIFNNWKLARWNPEFK
jgi:RIO-like serine/threonine protein kinase